MRSIVRYSAALLVILVSMRLPEADASKRERRVSEETPPTAVVSSWLILGPVSLSLPVLHDEERGRFGLDDLLKSETLPATRPWPAVGDRTTWLGGAQPAWRAIAPGPGGLVALEAKDEARPSTAWLTVYVATDRYRKLTLRVLGGHPRRAWLDSEPLTIGGIGAEADQGKAVEAEIGLATGTHRLLVQTIRDPERSAPWSAGAELVAAKGESAALEGLTFSTDSGRDLDILDILDPTQFTSLALSPDGALVATSLSRLPEGGDDAESWIEIRSTETGATVQSWRGWASVGQLAWAPRGLRLGYVTQGKTAKDDAIARATIWVADIDAGSVEPVVEGVENLNGYRWSPDGEKLVYAATTKSEPDKRGVKLHQGLIDRQAGWRDRSYLTLVLIPDRARIRLTAGSVSTRDASFSPDGGKLLFVRDVEDLSKRPYSRKELWEVDLETLDSRKLRDGRFVEAVEYAPDGRRILVRSGPSEFGEAGRDVDSDVTPNEMDGQLYVWDPVTDAVEAITRDFDPSVEASWWSRHDGRIYIKAIEGDRKTLWRWDTATRSRARIDSGVEVVQNVAFAEAAAVAAITGTSPWEPETLRVVDLTEGRSRLLAAPTAKRFERIRRGEVRPFVFTASSGRVVDGRVYLPPGFDATRRYPAIVYYYGGTNPVERDFGGRYPKEWWAANGYVVYVLQPTGAVGYGQRASAVHVNDWGETTSREIIEGTRAFLEAHPFVDAKRLGCIGASYGGFMTMVLATKTDLFAAAVSHAGISQLSSYWGEGYWGYSYSALATADSFPWNRQDIYVERSPLYAAHEAKTPILLTHGASDTNVPVGESEAFYTAMKLLGVPAEFLEVEGQDHWILDHGKRIVWSRSIVAWFDRWLKDRPDWWEALHPKGK